MYLIKHHRFSVSLNLHSCKGTWTKWSQELANKMIVTKVNRFFYKVKCGFSYLWVKSQFTDWKENIHKLTYRCAPKNTSVTNCWKKMIHLLQNNDLGCMNSKLKWGFLSSMWNIFVWMQDWMRWKQRRERGKVRKRHRFSNLKKELRDVVKDQINTDQRSALQWRGLGLNIKNYPELLQEELTSKDFLLPSAKPKNSSWMWYKIRLY